MDLRTGRLYASVEDARAAGVPESDIAYVVDPQNPAVEMLRTLPMVEFPKSPFGRLKNKTPAAVTSDDK